ncbi:AAA family ATPase [Erysipelotrichaceae bacterium HCN-30851]
MKQIMTGTENFKEIIDHNYYYVDKTKLIEDIITEKVVLYTRPRRFGKTLNMSMLYYFFSNKEKNNKYLFDGLAISFNSEIMKHQNQYPVISITLKDMKKQNIEDAYEYFNDIIKKIIVKHYELYSSPYIVESIKEELKRLENKNSSQNELENALLLIAECLYQHYGNKVIILIDEYDVPLQSAYLEGYYDEMVNFLRNVFSSALKTNDALEKGIMTGCLRIAKESIFTGLNNFSVRSILDYEAGDCFGFTQNEIDELLEYYDIKEKREIIKDWYDGYLFGNTEIYNPWSTLNYVQKVLNHKDFSPVSFWANTSGNDIIKQYIEHSDETTKEEFQQLLNGKSIIKRIKPELTYREMDFDRNPTMKDDVYSFLLFTGYLKVEKQLLIEGDNTVSNTYYLVIPNQEIKEIYTNIFDEWFTVFQNEKRSDFINSLLAEDEDNALEILSDVLEASISYYDNYESFYHGFLIGFLQGSEYMIQSNKESGDGRFDIALVPRRRTRTCIILECKHSLANEQLVSDSQNAAKQINEKNYKSFFIKQGYRKTIGYGISFYKKQCYITKA